MTIRRGEIWIANLDPTQGSEQAGVRPQLFFKTIQFRDTRLLLSVFLSPQICVVPLFLPVF